MWRWETKLTFLHAPVLRLELSNEATVTMAPFDCRTTAPGTATAPEQKPQLPIESAREKSTAPAVVSRARPRAPERLPKPPLVTVAAPSATILPSVWMARL